MKRSVGATSRRLRIRPRWPRHGAMARACWFRQWRNGDTPAMGLDHRIVGGLAQLPGEACSRCTESPRGIEPMHGDLSGMESLRQVIATVSRPPPAGMPSVAHAHFVRGAWELPRAGYPPVTEPSRRRVTRAARDAPAFDARRRLPRARCPTPASRHQLATRRPPSAARRQARADRHPGYPRLSCMGPRRHRTRPLFPWAKAQRR